MINELPETLRKLRVGAKYSQDFIAKKIDVSLSTYSRIERGEVEIDFATVIKLSKLYKLTVDELIHYEDPNFDLNEPKATYLRKWSVPITVSLDGTEGTLEEWITKLRALNAAL